MRSTSGTICCHFFCSAVFSMPVCRNPIVGSAPTMVSPSSSSTSRNTPCVLGCCGPMLTVIVSVRNSGIVLQVLFHPLAHRVNPRAMHFLNPRGHVARDIHVHLRQRARVPAV